MKVEFQEKEEQVTFNEIPLGTLFYSFDPGFYNGHVYLKISNTQGFSLMEDRVYVHGKEEKVQTLKGKVVVTEK